MRLSASPRKRHTMHAPAGDGFDWALSPCPVQYGKARQGMVDAMRFGPSVIMRQVIRGQGCDRRCWESRET